MMSTERKYLIKIDNELYYETDSLKEARVIAKSMQKRFDIENLESTLVIEKHVTRIEVLDIYEKEKLIINDMF